MKQKFLILVLFFFTQSSSAQNKTCVVKVLTFNILHGAASGTFDLDIIADVIIKLNPDFVALQEVDKNTERTNQINIAKQLGNKSKLNYVFGKAIEFDGGEYGIAILSKTPPLNFQNISLPFTKGNEARTLLIIKTVLEFGDTILFANTHLDHLPNSDDRIKQVKKINELFALSKYPTILAGDLNDTPESYTNTILGMDWEYSCNRERPLPTFPSSAPLRKIDYVLFRPKGEWKIINREVVCDSIVSDHCAYLVTLELLKYPN